MIEDIFPITDKDKLLGLSRSEIAQMVIDTITSDGVIPATYMSRICKYHFNHYHYMSVLKRLKLKGLDEKNKRVGGTQMKVYYCK